MLANDPYSHERALETLFPASTIIRDCSAENTSPTTIPART